MEWSFKSLSKCCAITGEPFKDGDEIICFAIKSRQGDLFRYDILSENVEKFNPEGILLGQWKRVFLENVNSTLALKQRTANREEFFISLFDSPRTDEGDLLKQIFALLLEQKRILRSLGVPVNGEQNYLHIRSKKNFKVPIKPFLPEDIASVEEFLNI